MELKRGMVAVITGGASGLGRALADECCARGMRVVVADIDGDLAQAVADELGQLGQPSIGIECDVSRPDSLEALEQCTVERFGAVHLLCNNAGVLATAEQPEATLADWRWTFDVNLFGAVYGLQAFLPGMRARGEGAHIVNVASFGGLLAGVAPGLGAYVASKFALVGLSEQLRFDLEPVGIGVTVVCPTGMPTNIHRAARNRPDATDDERRTVDERLAGRTRSGVAPTLVAAQTLDAVQSNKLYVINDTPLKSQLQDRYRQVLGSITQA